MDSGNYQYRQQSDRQISYVRNDPVKKLDPNGRDWQFNEDGQYVWHVDVLDSSSEFVGPLETMTITVTPKLTLADWLPHYSSDSAEDLIYVDSAQIGQSAFGFSLGYIQQGLAIVNDALQSSNLTPAQLSLGTATSISAMQPNDPNSKERLCWQEAFVGFGLSWIPLGTGIYDSYYNGNGFSGLLGSGIDIVSIVKDIGKDTTEEALKRSDRIRRMTGWSRGTMSTYLRWVGRGIFTVELGLAINEARDRYSKCME
jgi:hypothetical protein